MSDLERRTYSSTSSIVLRYDDLDEASIEAMQEGRIRLNNNYADPLTGSSQFQKDRKVNETFSNNVLLNVNF